MIYQHLFEVVSSPSPVLLQILRKVTSDNHPTTVWHETGLVHLSHHSIDDRHASLTLSPPLDHVFLNFPSVVGTIVDTIL